MNINVPSLAFKASYVGLSVRDCRKFNFDSFSLTELEVSHDDEPYDSNTYKFSQSKGAEKLSKKLCKLRIPHIIVHDFEPEKIEKKKNQKVNPDEQLLAKIEKKVYGKTKKDEEYHENDIKWDVVQELTEKAQEEIFYPDKFTLNDNNNNEDD